MTPLLVVMCKLIIVFLMFFSFWCYFCQHPYSAHCLYDIFFHIFFNVNYFSLSTDLSPLLSDSHKDLKQPLAQISGANIIVVHLEFDGQVLPHQVCIYLHDRKTKLSWLL